MEPTRRRGACRSNAISSGGRCVGSLWNLWCKEGERSAILLGTMEGLARGVHQLGACSQLHRSGALDTRIRRATQEEAESMRILRKYLRFSPKGARRQSISFWATPPREAYQSIYLGARPAQAQRALFRCPCLEVHPLSRGRQPPASRSGGSCEASAQQQRCSRPRIRPRPLAHQGQGCDRSWRCAPGQRTYRAGAAHAVSN
jgi:hypothetical protein